MLFNLAVAKSFADAVKYRDTIAKQLTPQQMAEAQKLARECQARDFRVLMKNLCVIAALLFSPYAAAQVSKSTVLLCTPKTKLMVNDSGEAVTKKPGWLLGDKMLMRHETKGVSIDIIFHQALHVKTETPFDLPARA